MQSSLRKYLRLNVLVRMAADAVMVNAALFLSLIGRYVWLVGVLGTGGSTQDVLREHIVAYVETFWLLTIVSLVVFSLNGFYSYGRFYQHRFKALIVAQAVSLSYLIFAFSVFLFWDLVSLPRSILIPAWLMTVVLLIGSRALLEVWRRVVWSGERIRPPKPDPAAKAGSLLVVGGAGYIGSALLPKLLERGYHVRVVDLLLYGIEPIRHVLSHPNLELVRADFRQVDAMVKAMRGVDAVIHLGGIVGDPACELDQDLTIEVNLVATRMLAEVARGSGVRRFLFASSCSVYGAGDEMLDEYSSLGPLSLYAKSKLASERALQVMVGDDFAPVILRFGTVYGLSGRTRFDLVVNLLTAKAVTDGEILVLNGDQWRPFVHVDDTAHAVSLALEAPVSLVRGQIFNVGSRQQNQTIRAVGMLIQGKVPTAKLIEAREESDLRNYRVKFDKIRRMLGFAPRWTLEEGIQQVINALRSGRILDYRDPEYSNVRLLDGGSRDVAEALRSEGGWARRLLTETPTGSTSRERVTSFSEEQESSRVA